MSQNDLVISNQTFPATRADITSALQALGSNNSGPSAPSTTYANMMWYDTTANILKIRSEANDGWISIGYLHQGENQFHILDDTYVADASGVHTGLLGDQTTATWQAGTGTTESLVSPAKVKASVIANAPPSYTQPTSTGAVGTYAFLVRNSNSASISAGQSISGSSLVYGSVDAVNPYIYETLVYGLSGTSPSGTWRAMGMTTSGLNTKGTVYLRIS